LENIPCGDFVAEYKSKEVYNCVKKSLHVSEYERNNEGSYISSKYKPWRVGYAWMPHAGWGPLANS